MTMSQERIRFQENSSKTPSDCIICAVRPALFLNQFNIYQAWFGCYHSPKPSRPQFTPSRLLKWSIVLCNAILIYGITNDLSQIQGRLMSKNILIILEIVFSVSTFIFNTLGLCKNTIKIRESHGLITIIRNKFKFHITEILTSASAKKVHDMVLRLILFLLVEETLMFAVATIIENGDSALLIRMCTLEFILICNASIGLNVLQFLKLYESMFERCFQEIELFLGEFFADEITFNKLQKLQRLYMCLRRNFQLSEDFLKPDIVIIYSIDICLLLIGYSYFAVMFASGEVAILKFDVYLILKSMAVVGSFGYICYLSQQVQSMSKDLISILYKCPLSKMSAVQMAQVEMLIDTLNLLKPELRASDIFTIGTGLIASISGTVLTYVLVALQFHALWATKN